MEDPGTSWNIPKLPGTRQIITKQIKKKKMKKKKERKRLSKQPKHEQSNKQKEQTNFKRKYNSST